MAKQHYVELLWKIDPDLHDSGRCGLLIEQLRYAGSISREEFPDGEYTLKIWCPKEVAADRREWWATRNAERMRSFGLAATAKVFR